MTGVNHLCLAGWDGVINHCNRRKASRSEITVFPYLSKPFGSTRCPMGDVLSFSQATNLLYFKGCEEIIRILSQKPGEYLEMQSINGIVVENILLQYTRVAGDISSPFQILAASRLLIAHYIQHISQARYDIILFSKLPHLYVDYLFSVAATVVGVPQYSIIPFRGLSRTWDECNGEAGIYIQAYDLNTYKRCPLPACQQLLGTAHSSYEALNSLVETFRRKAMHSSLKSSSKSPYLNVLKAGHNKDRHLDILNLYKDAVADSSDYLAGLKRSYSSVATSLPDNPKPFIFFPLHKQPEASTNPASSNDWSQEVIISQLGKLCKRLGLDLYVKEHPHIFEWSLLYTNHFVNRYKFSRSLGIYEALSAGIKNLTFLGLDLNPDYVISHPACVAVATSEGSSGISGLIHSKLVVLAGGDPWYSGHENCVNIKDILEKKQFPSAISTELSPLDVYIKHFTDNYMLFFDKSVDLGENREGIIGLLGVIATELCSSHFGS